MLEKTLQGRYTIISSLGSGGFSKTFLAIDQQQPDCPKCVIKQLEPPSTAPDDLILARRLFQTEAKVLQKLGNHPQIPQLFDHFEENQDFYLVQEFIDGNSLNEELTPGKQLSESDVIDLLQDILETLAFVHQQNVIHRDIKPSNLIRRHSDFKVVLIDFGAVKQITTQAFSPSGLDPLTVAIGTPGYLPSEQASGMPKFNSDIYAVGMIGLSALTGLNPTRQEFPKDPDTGEIHWSHLTEVTPELVDILDRMVRYDYRDRYQSVEAVLSDLLNLQRSLEMRKPLAGHNQFLSEGTTDSSQEDWYKAQVATQLVQRNKEISKGASKLPKTQNLPSRTLATTALSLPEDSQRSQGRTQFVERMRLALKPHSVKVGILIVGGAGTVFGFSQLFFSPRTVSKPPSASVASVSTPTPTAENSQALELLNKGDRFREAHNYNEALAAYEQVLKLNIDLKSAWWGQCYGLNVLQRYEEALKSCEKALSLDPNYPEALSSKGYALNALKRFEDAIASYKQALEIKPDYFEAWVNQGATLYNLQQYDEAIAAYDKALEIKPDFPEAWNNKGAVLADLKKYQESLEAYDKALQLKPDYAEAWNNRGVVLDKMQRYEEALASYEKALDLKPDYSVATENRQKTLEKIKP